MFESAELGHKVEKAVYDAEVPPLREALLDAQYDLKEAGKFPVLLIIGGVEGAGKGETVHTLNEWLDPRFVRTVGFDAPSDEENERPEMWRYWRELPPKGRIGIFFGSWYSRPIVARTFKEIDDNAFQNRLERIVKTERMLANEGMLILKFWFHISKDEQEKRLKKLQKDPDTAWRVSAMDWTFFEKYDKFRAISERALRETDRDSAPWIVVEGGDERYRNLQVGKTILKAIRDRIDKPAAARASVAPPRPAESVDGVNILHRLDLTQKIEKDLYKEELERWQGKLALLTRKKKFHQRSLVCVFEGNDAAGKGGAIRRVAGAVDGRRYRIVPIAAPTEEERAQPYLWRFWRHLPRLGRIAIFDRSWYGRVLVERVEGFCKEEDWLRAYSEINEFEEEVIERGAIICKFWLTISKEEQLKRFEARQNITFKRFKITEEDWRNRDKWEPYESAISDMVARTSSEIAPWTLVEANDKNFARIKVLRTLCERIEAAL